MLLNCDAGEDSWESILKEISSEYSLEGLMLKLKLQYFGYLMAKNWLIAKDRDPGKDEGRKRRGQQEDEIVGWHHRLDGYEFLQALGVGDGQGSPQIRKLMLNVPKGTTQPQWSRSRCFSGILLFSYVPADVGNLISGPSAFSKSSLNIWKFSVHILLKPHLENFECFFSRMWNECKVW